MISQILAGVVLIAIVYTLVNPQSPAVNAVTVTTGVMSSLIRAAVTGGS